LEGGGGRLEVDGGGQELVVEFGHQRRPFAGGFLQVAQWLR
jgi:hypothetical protein